MKYIKAKECEFCGHLTKSYSGMWKHEKKCFKNPESKSCITCGNYQQIQKCISGGRVLTYEEIEIYENVPNEHCVMDTPCCGPDDYGDYDDYPIFKGEYEYLNDVDWTDNLYCAGKNIEITKLTTNCKYWKPIKIKKSLK